MSPPPFAHMRRWFRPPPKPVPGGRGYAAFDVWTWVHLASGLALGVLFSSWLLSIGLLVGFEVLEAGLRRLRTKSDRGFFEPESWPNVLVDVLVGAAGVAVVRLAWPSAGLLA